MKRMKTVSRWIAAAIFGVIAAIVVSLAFGGHKSEEFYAQFKNDMMFQPTLQLTGVGLGSGTGTGTVVAHEDFKRYPAGPQLCRTYIITARHVMMDQTQQHIVDMYAEEAKITLIAQDKWNDLALVSIETLKCKGYPVTFWETEWGVPIHPAKVIISAYPLGLGPYVADGRIITWDFDLDAFEEDLLFIGAIAGSGASGGAVLYRGYFLGLLVTGGPTTAIGYMFTAVPYWYVHEFISRHLPSDWEQLR